MRLRRLLWQSCRPRVSALGAHLRASACKRHRATKTVHKLFQSPKPSLFPLASVFLRALFPNSVSSSPLISDLGDANVGAITWKVKENQSWDLKDYFSFVFFLFPTTFVLGNVSFRDFIKLFGQITISSVSARPCLNIHQRLSVNSLLWKC